MIIQEGLEKIIDYDSLTVEEKEDISLFFEHYGSEKIIEVDKMHIIHINHILLKINLLIYM